MRSTGAQHDLASEALARNPYLAPMCWLGVSGLLGVAIIVMTWEFLAEIREDVRLSREQAALLAPLDALKGDLALARASADRYLLTGVEDRRAQFAHYREAVGRSLTRLRTQVEGRDPQTRGLVTSLATDVDNALSEWGALLERRGNEGVQALQATLAQDDGTAAYREALDSEATLFAALNSTFTQHESDNAARGEVLIAAVALAAGINLALIATAAVATVRQVRRTSSILGVLDGRVDEADLINRFGAALQACRSMADARPVVRHFLGRFFPGSSGSLMVIRASRNAMEVAGSWGEQAHEHVGDSHEPGDCWALRQGRVHHVPDPGDALNCPHAGEHPSSPYVCVPMLAQGESVGVLTLTSARGRGGVRIAAATRLLETAAGQVGSAVASLQLRESLRHQSIRDALTGLYNRRYLEETMPRDQARAEREQRPLALIMIDLDHFKAMNDNHGHGAGDQVLKQVGELLRVHIRSSDIACRYGGEEMLMVLPGASLEQAEDRAQTIRRGIAALAIEHGGRPLPGVTASFGVAVYPEHGSGWEEVLGRADDALYQAKAGGRDRVVTAGRGDAPPLPVDSGAAAAASGSGG